MNLVTWDGLSRTNKDLALWGKLEDGASPSGGASEGEWIGQEIFTVAK